jgi:hypothetical protein
MAERLGKPLLDSDALIKEEYSDACWLWCV